MEKQYQSNPNDPVGEKYIVTCFKNEFGHLPEKDKLEIDKWVEILIDLRWTKSTFLRAFGQMKSISHKNWKIEEWKNSAESLSLIIKQMQREWSEISGIFSDCEWLFSLSKEEQIRYFATVRTIDVQIQERKFTVEKRDPLKKDQTVIAITPTNESIKYAEQNYWKLINAEKQALQNAKNRYEIYRQEEQRLNL